MKNFLFAIAVIAIAIAVSLVGSVNVGFSSSTEDSTYDSQPEASNQDSQPEVYEAMECTDWIRDSTTFTNQAVYKQCIDPNGENQLSFVIYYNALANIYEKNTIMIVGRNGEIVRGAVVGFQEPKTGQLTNYMTDIQAGTANNGVMFDKSDSARIVQQSHIHESVLVTMFVDDHYVSSIIPLLGFVDQLNDMIDAALKPVSMPTQEELMRQYVEGYMDIMLNQ